MTEATDAELLDAARAGDARAVEALLERHQARVYRFGVKMCRDPSDAEDVLQDTLLAAARNIREFRGASSLSTWLYTIAHRFCARKRRRRSHAPIERSLETDGAAEAERVADGGRAPDDALAGKQIEAALEQAIRALEPPYREVLLLRDVEGLTAPEVAEVLGIGVQAVKSRLHRARVAVRERVAPLLGVPGVVPTTSSDASPTPGIIPRPAAPSTASEARADEACPDVATLFSRHLEDEISADVCAAMERHVEGCPRCKSTCDSLRSTLALCRAPRQSEGVPAEVQASVKRALRELLGA